MGAFIVKVLIGGDPVYVTITPQTTVYQLKEKIKLQLGHRNLIISVYYLFGGYTTKLDDTKSVWNFSYGTTFYCSEGLMFPNPSNPAARNYHQNDPSKFVDPPSYVAK